MTQRHERHEFRRNRIRQMITRFQKQMRAVTKTNTKPNEKNLQEHMRAQATKTEMDTRKGAQEF